MWGWSLNVSFSDYRQGTLDVSLNFQKTAPFCCESEWSRTSFVTWCNSRQWASAFSLSTLHDRRHTKLITPLDEWSTQRRDLYLTTHKTPKRERERDIHDASGIRTRNPNKQAPADPRLRLRCNWDRQEQSLFPHKQDEFVLPKQNSFWSKIILHPRLTKYKRGKIKR